MSRSDASRRAVANADATPQVVVIGDVMTDVTVHTTCDLVAMARASDTTAGITMGGGGAGGNVAAWLAHLGVRVGLVAAVGDDDAGRVATARLRDASVIVESATSAQLPTGTVVALVDAGGERTMITDRGANAALTVADLPTAWFRPGAHLYMSGYTLFDPPGRHTAQHALALAEASNMTISVDPASWAPLRRVGPDAFLSWTAAAGHCLPNADEARLLADTDDLLSAAQRLGRHYGQVVVTAGADGALWSDGETVLRQPAAAGPVIDTTGAGDAFAAGYLAGLIEHLDVRAILRQGARAADAAIKRWGARPG